VAGTGYILLRDGIILAATAISPLILSILHHTII